MELYAVLIRGSLWVQQTYEMCYIYVRTLLKSKDKRQSYF